MFARVLTLAGGLSGAAGLSQFPEFSQQYAQRLGGAVEELQLFVEEFDADAAGVGMAAFELDPRSKASAETEALYSWISKAMNKAEFKV